MKFFFHVSDFFFCNLAGRKKRRESCHRYVFPTILEDRHSKWLLLITNKHFCICTFSWKLYWIIWSALLSTSISGRTSDTIVESGCKSDMGRIFLAFTCIGHLAIKWCCWQARDNICFSEKFLRTLQTL